MTAGIRQLACVAAVTLSTLAMVSCASGEGTTAPRAAASRSAAVTGTVTVFAAASLKEVFTAIGHDFETAHPGTTVVFNFGPSSGLATSLVQGAPADAFAAASPKTMEQVTGAGLASTATPFASNVMTVVVPAANPAHITALTDLAKPGVKVALCQSHVPCGAVAATVFAKAKVTVQPVSEEVDVKSVLTKVSLGEVDAGLVYVTDARAAGDKVKGIEIPAEVNASTTYPIAALTKAPNARGAAAFVAYVLSPQGQAVLAADGFAKP